MTTLTATPALTLDHLPAPVTQRLEAMLGETPAVTPRVHAELTATEFAPNWRITLTLNVVLVGETRIAALSAWTHACVWIGADYDVTEMPGSDAEVIAELLCGSGSPTAGTVQRYAAFDLDGAVLTCQRPNEGVQMRPATGCPNSTIDVPEDPEFIRFIGAMLARVRR